VELELEPTVERDPQRLLCFTVNVV
jgi:hypothetical protein